MVVFTFAVEPDDGPPPACFACVVGPISLLALWGVVYWPTTSTLLHQRGIVRHSLLRTRHFAWTDVTSWQVVTVDSDTKAQAVKLRMKSKLFALMFEDWLVARPGFDRFLELVRQHVGGKERPS